MDISFPLQIFALLAIFNLVVCQDEQTGGLGQLTRSGYVTTKSSDNTLLWIAVAFHVFLLFILFIIMVVVVKRKMKNKNEVLILQRKLAEIEGHRLNIEIERLTIEKRRLEIDENKLAFSMS